MLKEQPDVRSQLHTSTKKPQEQTSPSEANATDLTLALDVESFHAHLLNTHREICSHLYHEGFLAGKLSDVVVRAFDQSYRLHQILLVRSPFFERLLLSASSLNHPSVPESAPVFLEISIDDPNITPEAVSICLAFIYGAPIYSHIKLMNAHAVLACASLLELTSLAEICTSFILKTLSAENVYLSVTFVTGDRVYGSFTEEIQQGCLQLLSVDLPKKLRAFIDEEGREELVALFSKLPFSWLQDIIETKLVVPTEFEKYTFAKRVIEQRKLSRKGHSSTETVVLLFDQDAKGRVSVMEHASKKSLFKYSQQSQHSRTA